LLANSEEIVACPSVGKRSVSVGSEGEIWAGLPEIPFISPKGHPRIAAKIVCHEEVDSRRALVPDEVQPAVFSLFLGRFDYPR
jgi:hypothetical protein